MLLNSDIIIPNLYNNVTHKLKLQQLAQKSQHIQIICPFISPAGIDWLLEEAQKGKKVDVITALNSKSVLSGAQSLEALKQLMSAGCSVHFLTDNLHAKLYRFDKATFLISSANMTRSGLSENYELGILIQPGLLNVAHIKGNIASIIEYLNGLWNHALGQSEILTPETLEPFEAMLAEAKNLQNQLKAIEEKYKDDLPYRPYSRNQRDCTDIHNIQSHLGLTHIFEGFTEKTWEVFDHNMEPTRENLNQFRYLLDDAIDPLLQRLFYQLKEDPVFKKQIGGFDMGFSKSILRKYSFPESRYMYLTKSARGKRIVNHLMLPSYIIGVGKIDSKYFLEVRTGVEEDYDDALSEAGRTLISRMLQTIDDSVKRLNELGPRWALSHGSYSRKKDEYINLGNLTPEQLRNALSGYLVSGEASDIQIRRKYYLDNEEDRQVVLSSRVTSKIAQDIQTLWHFFELAHK